MTMNTDSSENSTPTDDQLRRAVSFLWPEMKDVHLTEEEVAYLAELSVEAPDELAVPENRRLYGHLLFCEECRAVHADLVQSLQQSESEAAVAEIEIPPVPAVILGHEPVAAAGDVAEARAEAFLVRLLETGMDIARRLQDLAQAWERILSQRLEQHLQARLHRTAEQKETLKERLDQVDLRETRLGEQLGRLGVSTGLQLDELWVGEGTLEKLLHVIIAVVREAGELVGLLLMPLREMHIEWTLERLQVRRKTLQRELQDTITYEHALRSKLQTVRTTLAQTTASPPRQTTSG
jgi:hypothetical protein